MRTINAKQILDIYKAAVYAKDVEAFMALYADDIHVFDMWEKWSYQGAVAWREMVEGWFGSLGTERVVVDFLQTESTQTEDMAVVHTFVVYKGVSAEGDVLRSMQNRMTCVLKKQGDDWKIIHEHSSGPASLETGKVIFK